MNSLEAINLDSQLPDHFTEFYPKFIKFMEAYFDWLNSTDITYQEMNELLEDDNWIAHDLEKFLDTGETKYLDFDSTEYKAETILNNHRSKMYELSNSLFSDTNLERAFSNFATADGEWFLSARDDVFKGEAPRPFMVTKDRSDYIDQYYKKFGFPVSSNGQILTFERKMTSAGEFVKDSKGRYILVDDGTERTTMRTMDHIRMIKLLKFVHVIKGTRKGIELFFNIFSGVPVNDVMYPKEYLMVLDGEDTIQNHIDGTSKLRDDGKWSEFSYIVKVAKKTDFIEFIFEEIYKVYFHPAGFYVDLET